MKKVLFILFLGFFCLGLSQKKKTKTVAEKETSIIYTEQDAENTKEPRVIAGFLKQNPTHPKSGYFKKKLVEMITAGNSPEAKPTIKPINKDKIAKSVSNNELNNSKANTSKMDKYTDTETHKKPVGASEKNKKTAALLTHLFNNDPNSKEVYINIKNKSKCNLIVKISGNKYYNLDVPARNENYILIEKGEYILTTMVCDAKYSSIKKITKDIEIVLNVSN